MKKILSVFVVLAVSFEVAASSLLSGLKPHPRLLVDSSTFSNIKSSMAHDEVIRKCAMRVKESADRYLDSSLPVYHIPDGLRLLSVSSQVRGQVLALSMAYRLFGDRRYLEKAQSVMCTAASFPDWNPKHFLDTAVMSFGVAIGYDWLYDDLAPEAKKAIRDALVEKGLNASLRLPGYRRGKSNWGQVCSGGIAAAALAVAEDEPKKCEDLFMDIKKHMPGIMKMYEPNGSYPEGASYWSFGTGYNVLLVALLESAIGNDLSLGSLSAFRLTGFYPDFVTGPSGQFFNYSDSGAGRGPSWIVWWFARRYGNPGIVEHFERGALDRRLNAKESDGKSPSLSPLFLLYYFPRKEGVSIDLPLTWRACAATDIIVQRSSWDSDGRFAAFKGGRAIGPHGHMDGGSFVYDAKGVRWACDLGPEDYVKAEHALGGNHVFWNYSPGSKRFTVFRLSPAAHNTLMLDGQLHRADGCVKDNSVTEGPLSVSTLDLTPLFTNATKVVRKGVMLEDGFSVVDRVEGLRAGAPIKWTMMTKTSVERVGAKLRLKASGKTLDLTRDVPAGASDWVIEKAPKGVDWESANPDVTRISFTVPSIPAGTDISVTFK